MDVVDSEMPLEKTEKVPQYCTFGINIHVTVEFVSKTKMHEKASQLIRKLASLKIFWKNGAWFVHDADESINIFPTYL